MSSFHPADATHRNPDQPDPLQPDPLHVVVGAGATGTATARLLASTGANVKVVTRSGSGPTGLGIELVTADASNSEQLIKVARGATALYNCANPPYHRWATDWPPLAESLLETAESTGAVLVTLNNLYGYAPPTEVMLATDEFAPTTTKGKVRAHMWHQALAAHNAGRVRVTEARASDFIGPDVGDSAHMGDRVVTRVLKGKSVAVVGRTDVDHSWTAIDDVARTLVALAHDPQAWGRAWHVPTVAPLSQRDLIHRMCELADVAPIKVSSMPSFALWGAGLVLPAMRELREITYQFTAPFVIDSQETTNNFGIEPTPLDDTLRATLRSYGHLRESEIPVHS